ncbi:hypothetical protein ABPG75_014027 [Micractinium tetrahymenae]
MRERASAAPASRLLAAALALATAVGAAASTFTELTYTVTSAPQTCGYLSQNFGSKYFDYRAGWSSSSYVPDGCTLEISSLYVSGTCSSLRNNNGQGCGGAVGTTVGGSNSSCQTVVQDASNSWWRTVYPNAPSTTLFDNGSLCAGSSTGYFYIHNTCNATFTFDVTLQIWTYSSCSGSGFPTWARITIGIIVGIVAMVILATAFRRCSRGRRPPPSVVQMAAPQQAPPGGYYAGAPAGYPPPGPAGYPPSQPYSQPSGYAGAWGAAPPAPGGYGAAGYGAGGYGAAGYGQHPVAAQAPYYPPPMTTVVLGAPEEEAQAAQGAGAQPQPQQGPAGANLASKV